MSQSKTTLILGSGYLGLALAGALRDHGHSPTVTTTSESRYRTLSDAGWAVQRLDVLNPESKNLIASGYDVVVAAVAPNRGATEPTDVYAQASKHMAHAMEQGSVARLVWVGSTGVYGQDDGRRVDEAAETNPDRPLARAILAAEQHLLETGEATDGTVCSLRLAGLYGHDRRVEDWARRAAGKTRHDGDAYLNLIHRDDAVAALAQLVASEVSGVLNWSDDQPTTRRELYDPMLREQGLEPVRWQESPSRGRRIDNRHAKSTLGLPLLYPRHPSLD